ncbi:5'-methylthioadenosine nucleosidase/S-adenosylhomocysteine nucleosidase [Desulforapulum autotrophicum HRM2]|uniref:Futalosine hydrolase n=1 Tax=Desulforapulum autotrophicum (strain ATCC 43914 / DSM 3382 / VKM B-1955 / HRM2) TaxID=177437 RepID=C0QI60_DESAH|nr:futalosine hydrolase [Desulforapulum autotrophicum]ACN15796.1 5'-methylthioadenosine nucleosidase/S-adenosylhomocysteine nucleosidase [Desulforapulum autotrophicum HRM2]
MNQRIVILVATRMEIAPFLEHCGIIQETFSPVGRAIIELSVAGQQATVVITGPGVVNTAQALTGAMEAFKPTLVIQTGIAGVFDQAGLEPGDVGVADSETYVPTGVENPLSTHRFFPLPFDLVDGQPESRQGKFSVNQELASHGLEILKQGFSKTELTIVKAGFITVSTVTASDTTANRLYATFQPCMESMEGAASAQVATLYNVDFMEIRAGSNRVGNRDKQLWQIDLATQRASRALYLFLKDCTLHPVPV